MKKLMFLVVVKRCIVVSWIILVIVSFFYLYKVEIRKIDDGIIICGLIWSNDFVQYLFYSKLEEIIKVFIFYIFLLIVIGIINILIGYCL